ncbi:uncharacterized protein LOC143538899 [Bidens hawaiensis]|uniref:uncharacterized protein LOC143538899 n=1 Tax=Bidens hawaiensis TaxID=980011 RepID=UPI00404B827E
MTNFTMSLKLLVNKQDHKIMFAEVNKDFVDFLFYILTLPIGAITKLLAKEPLSGSLGDLYQSIENLNDMYILQNKTKDTVLNPKSSTNVPGQDLLSIPKDPPTNDRKYYRCARLCKYVTDDPKVVCPGCRNAMLNELAYVSTEAAKAVVEEVGFVKDVLTYMVMDDLVVKPMSIISTITYLNNLSIKDISVLEEREVPFGMEEGLKLVNASLVCKNVLTCVFLDSEDHVKII